MIIVCRKLYHQELLLELFDAPEVEREVYPQKDYHTMYIGEVVKILQKVA